MYEEIHLEIHKLFRHTKCKLDLFKYTLEITYNEQFHPAYIYINSFVVVNCTYMCMLCKKMEKILVTKFLLLLGFGDVVECS